MAQEGSGEVQVKVVLKGATRERTEVLANLEKYGIEIEIDPKQIEAHHYRGRWTYRGPHEERRTKPPSKGGPRR